MSSCLNGGSRTYGFDIEIVKAITTAAATTRNSPASSSPSSTISDSSNSPLSICTRKARTQRKRPNQTYNEAAALLSTAYPSIFPAKQLTDPRNSHMLPRVNSPEDSSELFLPFRVTGDESVFLIHHMSEERNPSFFQIEPKFSPSGGKSCQTPEENEIQSKAARYDEDYVDNFEAESILDEEIEEGIIDSIMGEKFVGQETENLDGQTCVPKFRPSWCRNNAGALLGLGGRLDISYGFRRKGVSAWRDVGEVNWWNFPTVDVNAISPKLNPRGGSSKNSVTEKKKKKNKVEKPRPVPSIEADMEGISNVEPVKVKEDSPATSESGAKMAGLILKLDYNTVLEAWSGRGSPFPDDSPAPEATGSDVAARLAQIDLFGEGGGTREASVQRYKEKRRTRLFSKKIRYQVRKLNADCRPRMKGRFVRRPNSKSIKEADYGGIGNDPKPFRKK